MVHNVCMVHKVSRYIVITHAHVIHACATGGGSVLEIEQERGLTPFPYRLENAPFSAVFCCFLSHITCLAHNKRTKTIFNLKSSYRSL